MKTAEERVNELWAEYFADTGVPLNAWPELKRRVLALVVEQDRITRLECACAIASILPEVIADDHQLIDHDKAHAACMNVKAT